MRDALVDLLFRAWSPIYDSALFQKPFYRRVHARVMAALRFIGTSTTGARSTRSRVLRPGGRFVIATLTDTLLWKMMRQVRITTAAQFAAELEAAGFRVERSERVRPWVTLYVAARA